MNAEALQILDIEPPSITTVGDSFLIRVHTNKGMRAVELSAEELLVCDPCDLDVLILGKLLKEE